MNLIHLACYAFLNAFNIWGQFCMRTQSIPKCCTFIREAFLARKQIYARGIIAYHRA